MSRSYIYEERQFYTDSTRFVELFNSLILFWRFQCSSTNMCAWITLESHLQEYTMHRGLGNKKKRFYRRRTPFYDESDKIKNLREGNHRHSVSSDGLNGWNARKKLEAEAYMNNRCHSNSELQEGPGLVVAEFLLSIDFIGFLASALPRPRTLDYSAWSVLESKAYRTHIVICRNHFNNPGRN